LAALVQAGVQNAHQLQDIPAKAGYLRGYYYVVFFALRSKTPSFRFLSSFWELIVSITHLSIEKPLF
jgi:hypothetical protein